MKLFEAKRKKKHFVTMVCLLAGLLVLTSAVYANSDDAKGYTNFKNALKQTVLYEDNLTATGGMEILADGESMIKAETVSKFDGQNSSSVNVEAGNGSSSRYESYSKDGTYTVFYPDENYYYQYEGSYSSGRVDADDPSVQKGIRFMELLADTMVGDLKNNVVLVGGEDGAKDYTVNISGTQVPEVVNAGLSMIFTSYNSNSYNSEPSYVSYEEYMKAFRQYYQEQTGQELDMETYNNGDDELGEMEMEFHNKYEDILNKMGGTGIVYVYADGTYKYYENYEQFNEDRGYSNNEEIAAMMGNDPYIDSVRCDFSIDKEGRLTAIDFEAVMAGKDDNGKSHQLTMKVAGQITDYDSTTVDLPDLSGAEKYN